MLISGECSDSPLPPHPFTSTRTLFIHQLTAQIFAYATSILYFIPLKKNHTNLHYPKLAEKELKGVIENIHVDQR